MAEAKVSFRAETQVEQVSNIKHIYKLYPSMYIFNLKSAMKSTA